MPMHTVYKKNQSLKTRLIKKININKPMYAVYKKKSNIKIFFLEVSLTFFKELYVLFKKMLELLKI